MKKYTERFFNWLGNDAHPVFVTLIAYFVWLCILGYIRITGDDGSGQQWKIKQKNRQTLYKKKGLINIFTRWEKYR